MSITAITVNGTPLNLSAVEYDITIDHGRNDITSSPQPSGCQITVRSTTTLPIKISDLINIKAYGVDRFTGTVTDITLNHDYSVNGTNTARLVVQAMGSLSRLGLCQVGAAGFPLESLEDRVTAILDETGYAYTANVQPYMVLLAEDPGPARSALDWLSELCMATGATMADLPDGNILFESYTRRGVGYNPATWGMVTDPWSAVTYVWSDVYESSSAAPTPVQLPGGGVVWEPVWSNSVLTVLNEVTIGYDDPQLQYTASDAPSIALHGLRSATISTRLADATDAYDRANHVLTTQSAPHYGLQSIQILMTALSPATRTAVLGLIQGSRVNLANLPQPAPGYSYLGVVEGWSESYTTNGHFLTLSLSDPRYSYAVITWGEVPVTASWGAVPVTTDWSDALMSTDLAA